LTIDLKLLIIAAVTSVRLISVLYGASPKSEKASRISSPKRSSPADELEPIGAQGRAQYSFRNGSGKRCAVRTNQIQSLTRVFSSRDGSSLAFQYPLIGRRFQLPLQIGTATAPR
jgi:hypothetical protein